jgi:hypothetical protein
VNGRLGGTALLQEHARVDFLERQQLLLGLALLHQLHELDVHLEHRLGRGLGRLAALGRLGGGEVR